MVLLLMMVCVLEHKKRELAFTNALAEKHGMDSINKAVKDIFLEAEKEIEHLSLLIEGCERDGVLYRRSSYVNKELRRI